MYRGFMPLLLVSGLTTPLFAQAGAASGDGEAVRRAALDYIEAFYEGDSTKFLRGVRPEFYKYGFHRSSETAPFAGSQMTWDAALAYIRRVKQNNGQQPATAPKRVELLDVQDQTANAKVTAWWGTDYLLLGKYDGRWMISHVLWQSPPRKSAQ